MHLSQRECFLFGTEGIRVKNSERVVDAVKSALGKMNIPREYKLHVFPGLIPPSSIIIRVAGPDVEGIKRIDLCAISKILEICEKRNTRHVFRPLSVK